ncbi:hypothetical protein [Ruania alba]|nr:hypothetical protein [Ruania alba]
MLRRAAASGTAFDDCWDDLWTALCHQGTVYSASYAALPILTAMCLSQDPRGYSAPLQLAGAILASIDGPEEPAAVRRRYGAEVAQLHAIAERGIELAGTDLEFIYGLETLTSFEDGGPWSRNLSYLADGEAPMECAGCAAALVLHIDDLPATVTRQDVSEGSTPVKPTANVAGTEARLLDLATQNDRQRVADQFRYLFGNATCPVCSVDLRIASVLI